MPCQALVDGSTRQVVGRNSKPARIRWIITRSADRPVVPLACREILAISKVKYMLQQLEHTRPVKLITVRVVVVELKVQSSKPAAILLKNQRDEMKLNDH
jgi:hypothetical protein